MEWAWDNVVCTSIFEQSQSFSDCFCSLFNRITYSFEERSSLYFRSRYSFSGSTVWRKARVCGHEHLRWTNGEQFFKCQLEFAYFHILDPKASDSIDHPESEFLLNAHKALEDNLHELKLFFFYVRNSPISTSLESISYLPAGYHFY